MGIYGYTRKEFPDSLFNQLQLVQKYSCDEIYVEEEDLKVDKELNKLMMKAVKKGDTIVVSDIRVIGKNVKQLVPFVEILLKNEIRLISIKDGLDTQDKEPSFYRTILMLGELSRSCHAYMTKKALTNAREKGISGGRPTISKQKIKEIQVLSKDKGYSIRKIAEMCEVSVGTVHKYLKIEDDSEKTREE